MCGQWLTKPVVLGMILLIGICGSVQGQFEGLASGEAGTPPASKTPVAGGPCYPSPEWTLCWNLCHGTCPRGMGQSTSPHHQ